MTARSIFIFLLATLLVVSFSTSAYAQEINTDTLETNIKLHSPGKATLLSAFIPGAGQVYNKKYWKVPIIYGGIVALGLAINFNQREYSDFRDAYILRVDNDTNTVDNFEGIYTDSDLRTLRDFYRRNRDLSIIGASLVYILQVVDAHVDAHLFYFDVGEDLSMNLTPLAIPIQNELRPGLSLTLNIYK